MAAQDTDVKQTNTTIDSFGILPAMNNGFGFAIGANLVTDKNGATTVSNIGALIGSTGGSVYINASGAVNAQGGIVELLAGNVTVTAPTIAMAAGIDSFSSYAYHSATFVGINVSVEAGANNPLSAVQKGATYLNAADKTQDPQAKLLYEAAAGVQAAQGALNVYKAMDAPGGLTGAMTSFTIKIGVGVSVTTSGIGRHRPAGERRLHPGGGQSRALRDRGRPDAQGRQCQRLQRDAVGPARPRHAEPRAHRHQLFQEFELLGLRRARRERQLRRGGHERQLRHQRQRLGRYLAKPDDGGEPRADRGQRHGLRFAHLRAATPTSMARRSRAAASRRKWRAT